MYRKASRDEVQFLPAIDQEIVFSTGEKLFAPLIKVKDLHWLAFIALFSHLNSKSPTKIAGLLANY